jgi:hypothetical protein
MTVWRYFFGQFLIKIGSTSKIISRKQKIWHLQNFNHEFLTYQSVFLQNFKKIKNDTPLVFWTWTLQKIKWTTGLLSQNFFGHIFKFYIARPFPNGKILAIWFSGWKVMTIWRFFVDFFWFKTQFFQKSVKIAKKFFFTKSEYTVCLNIVQSIIYMFLGEIEDPKIYDRPSFSESAPYAESKNSILLSWKVRYKKVSFSFKLGNSAQKFARLIGDFWSRIDHFKIPKDLFSDNGLYFQEDSAIIFVYIDIQVTFSLVSIWIFW